MHEAAVAEILGGADYPALGEEGKREVLVEARRGPRARGRRARGPRRRRATSSIRSSWQGGRAVIGAEALGIYIISMTNGVSDILEVELLQGCRLGASHRPPV